MICLERFDPKTGKKTKIAEVFYAYSHLFRLIFKEFGYTEHLIKEDKALVDKLSTQNIPEIFSEISKTAKLYPNIKFFVLQYP
jgi:hypothetical protein